MSDKNRIETILALIEFSSVRNNNSFNSINSEFKEVLRLSKVTPNTRKNLLRILHSTRGLDTCLRSFLDNHNIRNGSQSLGAFLLNLQNHQNQNLSNLPQAARERFQKSIVDIRNQYMHSAGKVANNEGEVNLLISEMEACITIILNLED